ncbi:MAG TPA: hypothetical protein VGI55_07650 [Solirubrobacteraceae bacterium]
MIAEDFVDKIGDDRYPAWKFTKGWVDHAAPGGRHDHIQEPAKIAPADSSGDARRERAGGGCVQQLKHEQLKHEQLKREQLKQLLE